MIKVGGQSMTFMVDTEAEHSINHICGCLHRPNSNCCWGHRGHGSPLILQGPFIQVGGHLVTHEFLYLPECPIPLLGRDLLTKLGAQITFAPGKPVSLTLRSQLALTMAVPMPREDEWHLCSSWREQINPPRLLKEFPDVWAAGAQVWPESICPL